MYQREAPTMIWSAGKIEPDRGSRDNEFAAAIDGDPAARWRALEACRDYLRLVARRGRWSGSADLPATSDIVQNTCVDAWRDFSRFRGRTPGQFRAWLKAILIHASLRDRRRPLGLDLYSEARSKPASPSQAAQQKAAHEALDAALGRLSQRHRSVIHLRIWEQSSFAQIGEKLDVSEDAARMLFGRALANLREAMRPGHDPG
jgi:RNA polymerase sigma-70 factor, ECF subfamily